MLVIKSAKKFERIVVSMRSW